MQLKREKEEAGRIGASRIGRSESRSTSIGHDAHTFESNERKPETSNPLGEKTPERRISQAGEAGQLGACGSLGEGTVGHESAL